MSRDEYVPVRVAAAGVNPVDTYIREGQYAVLPTLPYTPGRDGAGIVEEVGEDVSHVKAGDRVYFLANHTGSSAEYCLTDKVLVRVAAAGVNPVDTYIREGQYAVLPTLPYTPGRDGAGIVEEVGEDVSHVKAGDRVYFLANHTGSAAEYCLTDKKGQRVLVHGASGGVGLAAVQMAANFGAIVVGTAGTEEGIELVRKNGARDVFNHRVHGYSAEMKTTYPDEMTAHLNLATDLDLLARNGKVAVVGSRGEVTVNPRALMTKESSVYGVTLANSTEEELTAASNFIWNFLCSSHFRPVIHRIYPLSEIATAHSDVMAGSGTKGKLIVHIADL
ncbi:GroES-like protein [Ancylostoma caninum]|uniref:GroES-like protein n=1 Tax=Ancylostoma caninum TaxID=29170 RepID=A0A368FBP1_ANCCA|nr:GroES-like protein [Ancylostoma caninum]